MGAVRDGDDDDDPAEMLIRRRMERLLKIGGDPEGGAAAVKGDALFLGEKGARGGGSSLRLPGAMMTPDGRGKPRDFMYRGSTANEEAMPAGEAALLGKKTAATSGARIGAKRSAIDDAAATLATAATSGENPRAPATEDADYSAPTTTTTTVTTGMTNSAAETPAATATAKTMTTAKGELTDTCGSPLGKFTVSNEKVFNSHQLFSELDSDTYKLRPFQGRNTIFLPHGGFTEDSDFKYDFFQKENEKIEAENVMKSGLGDLASPILNGSYHVFGIRSYLRIKPCRKCMKNVCDIDHLLQALVQDIHDNKTFGEGVAAHNLDLQRNFQHVRIFDEILIESPMHSFFLPRRNEQPKVLPLDGQEFNAYEFGRLNQYYFPGGEIRLNDSEKSGFRFDLAPNTPSDGVIVSILQSLEALKDNKFELAFSILEDSNEPKDLKGQTREAASYALFVYFIIKIMVHLFIFYPQSFKLRHKL